MGRIDTKNWTIKDIDSNGKLTPDMVAMQQYAEYEKFRNKIHGYKDKSGILHDGELDTINADLKEAQAQLGRAYTDIQFKAYYSRLQMVQKQRDDLLNKEKYLRERYQTAQRIAEQSSRVRINVIDYRVAMENDKDRKDKEVRVPSQSSINDFLQKQESEIVF